MNTHSKERRIGDDNTDSAPSRKNVSHVQMFKILISQNGNLIINHSGSFFLLLIKKRIIIT